MPIFDFGSVDEAKPLLRQYNWGYDPLNYNVPEGSYATDAASGRIESNKIGLRTCAKIMAQMSGGFKRYTENGKFKEVHFAIFDDHNAKRKGVSNVDAFAEVFS